MITYWGLTAPDICDYLTRENSRAHYAEGTEFHIGKIEMVATTGTYLDSPFHRYADGRDLADLLLSSIADLDGIVIRAREPFERVIDAPFFQDVDARDKAVLVHTGWDKHWGREEYFEGHPFLTADAARLLAAAPAKLVGIDSLNIDDTRDPARSSHSILLKAGIPIVEHLCNLEDLPDAGFRFFAVPAKVRGMGSFPVRAFGIIN